jgi:hypothetical protein
VNIYTYFIFKIKKMIRSVVGVSSRMSHRQVFKEFNNLTLALLRILEVTSFITKYCQSLELNSKIHKYNTQKKMDINV